MGYIILNDKKQPAHKFKNTEGMDWEDVCDFENLAQIVPKPFVVLDFDTSKEAEIMLKIIEGLDLKCKVMKTTRGIHCWFRNEQPMKNVIKSRTAIGLYLDRKSHSKNAYVVIKQNGEMRKILKDIKDEEIEEIPFFLKTVITPPDKFNFVDMGSGDGRNQEIFNYILYLQGRGFTKEEIKKIIQIINDYVFSQPLPEYELSTLLRDDAFKKESEIANVMEENKTDKDNKFNHVALGSQLLEEYKLLTVNDNLYMLKNGVYQMNYPEIKKRLNVMRWGITERQRVEVINYLKVETNVSYDEIKYDPYELAIRDTKINVKTGELVPYKDTDYIFNKLDVTYNPNITHSQYVDQVINNVFVGDDELIDLFFEIVGTCLVRKSIREKAFIFVGDGSNGKSTVLMMLQNLFKDNYSALDLDELTGRFGGVELENKLVNIGDDIDGIVLRNTSKIKKIIAGNPVYVERKGQQGYIIIPTATHIFSANKIPHSVDKSNGFYRRLAILPFNANFNDTKDNFDPNIIDKLCTEEAKSYLLNKGIEGIQRVFKQGHFTRSKVVEQAEKLYQTDNSNVLTWIFDEELEKDYFLLKSREELYSIYIDWCNNSYVSKPSGKKNFYDEVRKHFNFNEEPARKRINGMQKRYFQLKTQENL